MALRSQEFEPEPEPEPRGGPSARSLHIEVLDLWAVLEDRMLRPYSQDFYEFFEDLSGDVFSRIMDSISQAGHLLTAPSLSLLGELRDWVWEARRYLSACMDIQDWF